MTKTAATAPGQISGVRRAALLLCLLPDEAAAPVLARLKDAEVEAVGVEMARLGVIDAAEVREVARQYLKSVPPEGSIIAGIQRFEALVGRARGEDAAGLVRRVGRALTSGTSSGDLDVSKLDPAALAGLLEAEPPQAIAVVLSRLAPKISAAILNRLSSSTRTQVASRLAQLERVDSATVEHVLGALRIKVESLGATGEEVTLDGVRLLSSILDHMTPEASDEVLDSIQSESEELAEQIRDRSVVFEDIKFLGDRDMQAFVQRIDKRVLPLALKGAPEDLRAEFQRGMSGRAAASLGEEMQLLGAVRLAEVEKAQATIIQTLKKLIEEGAVTLNKGGEGLVS